MRHGRARQAVAVDVEQGVDVVADDERVEKLAVAFAHAQARPLVQAFDARLRNEEQFAEFSAQRGILLQVTQQRHEDAQGGEALLSVDDVDVVAAGVLHEDDRPQEVVPVVRAPRAKQIIHEGFRLLLLPHVGALEVRNLVLAVAVQQLLNGLLCRREGHGGLHPRRVGLCFYRQYIDVCSVCVQGGRGLGTPRGCGAAGGWRGGR